MLPAEQHLHRLESGLVRPRPALRRGRPCARLAIPVDSSGACGRTFVRCTVAMDSLLGRTASPEPAPSIVAEKRDLLGRLLGRLAHEIRNPLSSLDIHVQLLEEDLAHTA